MADWYAKGETGEKVLDVVEFVLDGGYADQGYVMLRNLGLSEEEAISVINAAVVEFNDSVSC